MSLQISIGFTFDGLLDPGALKKSKMKENTQPKRKIIVHICIHLSNPDTIRICSHLKSWTLIRTKSMLIWITFQKSFYVEEFFIFAKSENKQIFAEIREILFIQIFVFAHMLPSKVFAKILVFAALFIKNLRRNLFLYQK
jgi:hypothetical protein